MRSQIETETFVIRVPKLDCKTRLLHYLAGDFACLAHAAHDLLKLGAYVDPAFLLDLGTIARDLAEAIGEELPMEGSHFAGSASQAARSLSRSISELEERLGRTMGGGDRMYRAPASVRHAIGPSTFKVLGAAFEVAAAEAVNDCDFARQEMSHDEAPVV